MRQRTGSTWMSRNGATTMAADRTADGAARHRPRSRHGLSGEQESVLELQRLAGNAAVTAALGQGRSGDRVTSVDAISITRTPTAPEMGIHQIREHTTNKMTLALTRRTILDKPPIMLPDRPEKTKDGFTAKTQKVSSIPEPEIDEWWPTEGNHKMSEGNYLAVDHDWAQTLEKGEDEHRDDAKLAWEKTWQKVQATINSFANKPGPPQPTAEAAEKELWQRYVAALPKDLQPQGDRPSVSKQLDVLAIRPGNIMAWMWETTVARDQRNNHETVAGPAPESAKPPPKGASLTGIKAHPDFKVKGPTSEAFSEEIRQKYAPNKRIQGSKLADDGAPGNATK